MLPGQRHGEQPAAIHHDFNLRTGRNRAGGKPTKPRVQIRNSHRVAYYNVPHAIHCLSLATCCVLITRLGWLLTDALASDSTQPTSSSPPHRIPPVSPRAPQAAPPTHTYPLCLSAPHAPPDRSTCASNQSCARACRVGRRLLPNASVQTAHRIRPSSGTIDYAPPSTAASRQRDTPVAKPSPLAHTPQTSKGRCRPARESPRVGRRWPAQPHTPSTFLPRGYCQRRR